MFGWRKATRNERQEQSLPTAQKPLLSDQKFERFRKDFLQFRSEIGQLLERVDSLTHENQSLVEIAKGEPFSALHKWIAQSTERESQARWNEREYVARWREHAKSLTEQVELLKSCQIKPRANLRLVFTQESSDPDQWRAFAKAVDWPLMVPVGASLTLRLYGDVFIYPVIEQYSVENIDEINASPELWVMLKPYRFAIDEKASEYLPLYGYKEQRKVMVGQPQ
jgi:hypothetical protein